MFGALIADAPKRVGERSEWLAVLSSLEPRHRWDLKFQHLPNHSLTGGTETEAYRFQCGLRRGVGRQHLRKAECQC